MDEKPHKHKWESSGQVREARVSHSPCSTLDDILYDAVILIQTCSCGRVKRTHISNERERFRGDDMRRAKGLRPFGNLPGSYG